MEDIIKDFIKWFDLLENRNKSGIKNKDLSDYIELKIKELGKQCKVKDNQDPCDLCKYTEQGDGITPCTFCVTFTDPEIYFN